ncbi:hypothetical protein Golax_010308, partial [Gossypium laxum]|nr:hypothetical protein [Gossypium laxum]
RGEEVSITPKEICEFYNAPFYDKDFLSSIDLDKFENIDMKDVIKYLTQGRERTQVCVGKWIYREMSRFLHSKKDGIFFPHLVTELCRWARVLMGDNE